MCQSISRVVLLTMYHLFERRALHQQMPTLLNLLHELPPFGGSQNLFSRER
jgi:hypothetical protein